MWVDAATDDGWISVKEVTDSITRQVVSVGWIVQESPLYVILAADRGVNDQDTNRRLTIPKSWIDKITNL